MTFDGSMALFALSVCFLSAGLVASAVARRLLGISWGILAVALYVASVAAAAASYMVGPT